MKLRITTIAAAFAMSLLFGSTAFAQAGSWWGIGCPAGASLETGKGKFRCVKRSGGANAAPVCPKKFSLVTQQGTDTCSKGGRGAETRPVKCPGKKWQLRVDNAGDQDQCTKGRKKKKHKADKVKNAKCKKGFTYTVKKGTDVCVRGGKSGKTKSYKCKVGSPVIDKSGSADRCVQQGTTSYVQPTLTLRN